MEKLTDLPNISGVIAGYLEKTGITTPAGLREAGSRDAFVRIRLHAADDACLNMLCALEGAIQGVRWHNLPEETKAGLREFHKSLSPG